MQNAKGQRLKCSQPCHRGEIPFSWYVLPSLLQSWFSLKKGTRTTLHFSCSDYTAYLTFWFWNFFSAVLLSMIEYFRLLLKKKKEKVHQRNYLDRQWEIICFWVNCSALLGPYNLIWMINRFIYRISWAIFMLIIIIIYSFILVAQSCLTLWPHGLYIPWNSPAWSG